MTHELKLYDVIGGWGISAQEFTDAIPADATDITVRINSPGGSVGDGLAIYNYLKDHPARVETIVDGYAASMASIVLLAGDEGKRKVHAGSIVMIHNPWSTVAGNADELRKSADDLDVHADALKAIYLERTGIDADELQALMDGETYLTGETALELGFADAIVENESPEQAAAYQAFAAMLKPLAKGLDEMSKVKTRKDIAAERDELAAKVEELQNELVEAQSGREEGVKALEEAHGAAIQAKDEAIAALTAEVESIGAKVEEAEAKIVEITEDRDTLKSELEQIEGDIEAKDAELEQAKAALKNPAIADAILQDVEGARAAIAQFDAEAEAAEAKAKAEAGDGETETPHYDAYRELMANGEARKARSYWRENQAEIEKEQKAIIAAEQENDDA